VASVAAAGLPTHVSARRKTFAGFDIIRTVIALAVARAVAATMGGGRERRKV
jgi:hypothetical protein